MYLFFAVALVLFGLWISPVQGISDVPFSQLTLKMISGSLVGLGAYIGSMVLFVKSLEHDRIWPWRWAWPYFVKKFTEARKLRGIIEYRKEIIEYRRELGYDTQELEKELHDIIYVYFDKKDKDVG